MQKKFMSEVVRLIEDGKRRALLISATGTGKTYAAAFAVRRIFASSLLRKKKVLFLSHREMINVQAEASFKRVLGESFHTAQLSGHCQDMSRVASADIVFSTMNMMAKDSMRNTNFSRDAFSVIILDECHRSGAESYQKIIDYFMPDFLLGMSASPDRTDGFNVYEFFDYNIACEIRLQTALENDLLCPFHYFGIQDLKVDGRQVDVGDFSDLTSEERVKNIVDVAEYYGYSGDRVRGLVFCSSVDEAQKLSSMFNSIDKKESGRKYRTWALSGDDNESLRQKAVEMLASESDNPDEILDYIFTVDIFNEGVDIPEINQVIMLRPTKSAIIFVQQLGRGLRKAKGKEYVVVMDFIANYDNNYLIPVALSGDRTGNKDNIRRYLIEGNNVIKGASTIYFDSVARKRIFESIDKARINTRKILLESYRQFKEKLNCRPRLTDFDKYEEMDPLRILSYMDGVQEFKKRKICSYYGFLVALDGLEETLSEAENHILEYVSQKFASGKRLNEIIMLEILMSAKEDEDVLARWKTEMTNEHLLVGAYTELNIISLMNGQYYNCGSTPERFSDCVFIEEKNGRHLVSGMFLMARKNKSFCDYMSDLLQFARGRYDKSYRHAKGQSRYGDVFMVGQKYTYEDVIKALDFESNSRISTVFGYMYDERTKSFPVFVNYDKDENISESQNYKDRFVDQSTIITESKHPRDMSSPDVVTALNSVEKNVSMLLFVRKNKKDKSTTPEFYYLGAMAHVPGGYVKEVKKEKASDNTVEIEYRLETPVEKNLYDYLISANI